MTELPADMQRRLQTVLVRNDETPIEPQLVESLVRYFQSTSTAELVPCLQMLSQISRDADFHAATAARLLQALVYRVNDPRLPTLEVEGQVADPLAELLRSVNHAETRAAVLSLLAHAHHREDMDKLVAALIASPPEDAKTVGLVMGTLMQRRDYDAEWLFPKLLEGITHPQLAAAVLDLSNYFYRTERMERHPAADRRQELSDLLRNLTQSLLQLEESSPADADARELQRLVANSTAIGVALCDALALIGDLADVGRIRQVLQVRHRRLRTEAAAALVRYGEEDGIESLVELAGEPVARLRVLAYADEFDLADKMKPEFCTEAARAEAELALWLAQPEQMGIPPMSLELLDQRTQFWPGYDDPVDCFLFRYTYQWQSVELSNVGLVGPLTHSLRADLSDLSPEDIYAVFAGWDAEHEEIFELQIDHDNPAHQADLARLKRRLQDRGYDHVVPLRWGMFFGDRVLIAQAEQEGQPGYAVVDAVDVLWIPYRPAPSAVGDRETYQLYKGRKLLRTFNPT